MRTASLSWNTSRVPALPSTPMFDIGKRVAIGEGRGQRRHLLHVGARSRKSCAGGGAFDQRTIRLEKVSESE